MAMEAEEIAEATEASKPEARPEETSGPPTGGGGGGLGGIPVTIVTSVGFLLIILSALSSGRAARIWKLLYTGQADSHVRNDLAVTGGQFVFVLLASLLAETGGDSANLVFTFFAAILFLWTIKNTATLQRWYSKVQPGAGGA